MEDFISYYFEKILVYFGYKIEDKNNLLNYPSKIIIISSHTSIYDFLIGLFFYYAILHKKYDSYILMKESFQKIIYPIMKLVDKKIKFISVDNKKNGLTNKIYEQLKNENNYILFIAPEGTRKCTEYIKTGYWNIAKKLQIDIAYLGIDFITKDIILEKSRKPFNKWEEEEDYFITNCKKYIPLYPERCFWTRNFYS